MSAKRSSSKDRRPLRREDLHKHPKQGARPWQGPPSRPHPEEAPVWQPLAGIPAIMHPHVAGSSGFTTADMHVPGPFHGLGPRNYAKPDARVLEDVCELLTRHGELDVRGVDVHCRDGVVRLEGSVPTRRMRREVEAACEAVFGVTDVENHLEVKAHDTDG